MTLLVVLSLPAVAQDRHDGNWWLLQSETAKAYYTLGFFDGIQTGREFSLWDCDNNKDDECIRKADGSFMSYAKRYLVGVSTQQLADGLNAFYKDYRNRKILVQAGVWVVLNEIAGTPREKIDRLIETDRPNATDVKSQ